MSPRRDLRRLLLAALLGCLLAAATDTAALAQPSTVLQENAADPGDEVAESEDPAAEISRKRATIAAEKKARERELASAPDTELIGTSITAELELLDRIDLLYAQQLGFLENAAELDRRWLESERRMAADVAGVIAQEPPFTLELLDSLEEQRDSKDDRILYARSLAETLEATLGGAGEMLAARETGRRLELEALERVEDEVEAARRRAALRIDELRIREAEAQQGLTALGLENARRELVLEARERELAERAVEWVRANLALDDNALKAPLAALEQRRQALKREVRSASLALEKASRRLEEAERRLDEGEEPGAPLVAEVQAKREARTLARRRILLANELLGRISEDRELWDLRGRTLSGRASPAELHAWERQLRERIDLRESHARIVGARLAELRQHADELRSHAEADTAAKLPRARWVRERVRTLEELVHLYEDVHEKLVESRNLTARGLGEILALTAEATPAERVRGALADLRDASRVEVFSVDERSVTLGKIVAALLLVVAGFFASRVVSRLVGRAVLRGSSGAQGAASAVQGLVFYFLLFLFALFALRVINIPLTAFTVAGGALAIGVGFGTQNIINNFISGIILMAERPIKVGDLIEVEGTRGQVERIGPRATRVRTFANTHIIVPNSAFLENSVVNWTHSDDDIRTSVEVGVVYGSPTREVDRLIHKAVSEHGQVLKSPEPNVFFTDFGDNALQFRVTFWIRSRDMLERRRIESDVRYRIDHVFREAGIVVAFPQRDVHLDTTAPLEVRVLDGQGERGGSTAGRNGPRATRGSA